MVGNALAVATIFAGTVMPLIVVGTMLPTPVLFALSNARVAMAGTAAGTVPGAESETCPATGSVMTGVAPGRPRPLPVAGGERERRAAGRALPAGHPRAGRRAVHIAGGELRDELG